MSLSFDVQNILVLLVGFIGMIYGLIVYSGNKKNKTNIWFFLFVLSVAFWYISMFFFRSSIDVPNAIFWARILYLSATFIPACFLGFSYIFPEDKTFLSSWKNYLIFIPFALVAVLSLLPNVLILNVNIFTGKEKEIIFNKLFYHWHASFNLDWSNHKSTSSHFRNFCVKLGWASWFNCDADHNFLRDFKTPS